MNSVNPMTNMMTGAIFMVGTLHKRYQIRPRSVHQHGADAFKQYIKQTIHANVIQIIAEEMSIYAFTLYAMKSQMRTDYVIYCAILQEMSGIILEYRNET
jgi:hypothetical protein